MPATKAVLSIAGQAAEDKIGKYGYFEGTYSAILNYMNQKGLSKQNVIEIGYNSTTTNYYIFYWK